MCKFCWGISALLLVAVGAMTWMFVVRGSVVESSDERTAILLTAAERDLVLGEMRGFLETVQAITEAITENDMKAVYEAAHKSGMAAAGGVPASLMGKLPIAFKKLGLDTHRGFDAIAQEAQDMGEREVTLKKLGELLNNCTNCHAGYRLAVEGSGN